MMRILPVFAVLLASCAPSTITVKLEPASEAQVNSGEKYIREERIIHTVELPAKMQISVPFTSQAPHANWENPYQEACEEAAAIMVDYFHRGAALTPDQANREILQLVNWEQANGYPYDVNLNDLSAIIRKYYKYETRISDDVSKGTIMHEISKGNPVIIPAAGRMLGNPYYSGEGPWYHMLVVTGYDSKYFITNDPGTRRGERYKYKHDVLLSAVHDWTGVKEEIQTGVKKMLVVTMK